MSLERDVWLVVDGLYETESYTIFKTEEEAAAFRDQQVAEMKERGFTVLMGGHTPEDCFSIIKLSFGITKSVLY